MFSRRLSAVGTIKSSFKDRVSFSEEMLAAISLFLLLLDWGSLVVWCMTVWTDGYLKGWPDVLNVDTTDVINDHVQTPSVLQKIWVRSLWIAFPKHAHFLHNIFSLLNFLIGQYHVIVTNGPALMHVTITDWITILFYHLCICNCTFRIIRIWAFQNHESCTILSFQIPAPVGPALLPVYRHRRARHQGREKG